MGRVLVDFYQPISAADRHRDFLCDVSWNVTLTLSNQWLIDHSLVLFMVPPTGIVFIFILAAFTLIFGMALGWAWGVIAMKAAMAARPAAETQARIQALGQTAYSQANSTGQALLTVEQELVYAGFMLDARVTAVYFCLICLMIYLLVSEYLISHRVRR